MLKTEVASRERVPDRSKLELRVRSKEGALGSGATLMVSGKPPEKWPQSQIHPGPKRKKLRSPQAYVLQVDVGLLDDEEVDVEIKIVTPEGPTHGRPVRWDLDGGDGDALLGILFIKMIKTGSG